MKYIIKKLQTTPLKVTGRLVLKKMLSRVINQCINIYRNIRPLNIPLAKFYNIRSNCRFLFDESNKQTYVSMLNTQSMSDVLKDADQICDHLFDLLGSGMCKLQPTIPWNKDFKTGFCWPNQYYKLVKTVNLKNTADIKVPWELSRFQHLFTLGKAYWLTSDEKYVFEFKNQIVDWIKYNPYEMSVNWTCAMDVAIRAVNWIAASHFFRNLQVMDASFSAEFHRSLYLHGVFIYNNLENKGKHTGNHYLSDIVGLVWIGLYFGSFRIPDWFDENHPQKWLDFGLEELEKEMFIQVNPDGTNYEASTSYHRLVTELFLNTSILCNLNNIHFSKEYSKRLELMCNFIKNITKPNGKAPLFGDSDDGRLLIFSNYGTWEKCDFRYILAIAGEYFNRNDFRLLGSTYYEDVFWCNGHIETKVTVSPATSSTAYTDGGYYILANKEVHCLIRCGELSYRGQGVHSHNDQLSFELNVRGEDFIVDPGSFIYSGDYKWRNIFRSTSMHNTVEIDGFEQNDFDPYNLFYMKEQTFSKMLKFNDTCFVGEHYGYLQKNGTIHQRKIIFQKESVKILDALLSDSSISGSVVYHLDPDVRVQQTEQGIRLTKNKTTIEVIINCHIDIKQTWISREYGVKSISKKIVVPFQNALETTINIL